MTKDEIREGLEVVVHDLDRAINRVKREHPEDDDAFRLQFRDGRYVLLDALAAKATALGALATLEAL